MFFNVLKIDIMEVKYTDSFIFPEGLRPDIKFTVNNTTCILDTTVVFVEDDSLVKASKRKLSKYANLGLVIPIVVGAMSSWLPDNILLKNELCIPGQLWAIFQSDCSKEAIEGSSKLLSVLIHTFIFLNIFYKHVVFNYFTGLFILFNILHKNRFILLPHFLI